MADRPGTPGREAALLLSCPLMQEHVTFENLCIFPESNGGFLIRL